MHKEDIFSMKIGDNIILITTGFPYGNGENFIDAEIKSIAGKVNLTVQPFNSHKGEIRNLPKGVTLDSNCLVSKDKISRIKYGVRAIMRRDFWKEILRGSGKSSFIKLAGYIGRSIELAEYIEKSYIKVNSGKGIVLYSYWLMEGAYAAALLKKKYKHRVVAVSRAHRVDVWNDASAYGTVPTRKITLKYLDKVYVCSQNGVDYLKKLYEKYTDKFICGYLGTEEYGWHRNDNRESGFVVVSCARIEPVKRVELLVRALQKIDDINVHWIHFGDGSCRSIVEAEIKNLPSNIIVEMRGTTKHEDVMKYYQDTPISLFVNTSSSEGLPVSIMEVMSFGTPVIATDVGGTREIVSDVVGNLIDKNFDVDYLSELIRHYAGMKSDEYRKLRANARNVWEDKFCAQKNYNEFYHEITTEYWG